MSLGAIVFYAIAALTVGSALIVAFSRSIVYSAFALLGTFMGVAGLYVLLAADFVAVVQVLVYVGGILVLILFAVMLTHRISDVQISNRSVGQVPALLIIGGVVTLMSRGIFQANWSQTADIRTAPTTYGIGDAFLRDYILPFELASVVLLAALIGAIVLSRKEIK